MESGTLRSTTPPALTKVGLVGALLALAAAAWLLTVERMDGMDMGPGTDLGSPGWFAVTWALMMAAMMVPSLGPAALAFAQAGRRPVAFFVAGYLAVWTAAGLATYAAFEAVRALDLDFLTWDRAGRYAAAGVILAAAGYQFTAGKERCLARCRSPLMHALEEWPGAPGAVRGGLRHGASCIGCCVGLMAALFALGVMSVTWMVVIAALIAAERLLPRRTPAVYGVAATLGVLGALVFVAGPL
jgi:predicted metal-binding membrane protein